MELETPPTPYLSPHTHLGSCPAGRPPADKSPMGVTRSGQNCRAGASSSLHPSRGRELEPDQATGVWAERNPQHTAENPRKGLFVQEDRACLKTHGFWSSGWPPGTCGCCPRAGITSRWAPPKKQVSEGCLRWGSSRGGTQQWRWAGAIPARPGGLCPACALLLALRGDGCRGAAAKHPTEDTSPAWACCERGERRAATHFARRDLQKRCLLLLFPAKHGGHPGSEGWKPCWIWKSRVWVLSSRGAAGVNHTWGVDWGWGRATGGRGQQGWGDFTSCSLQLAPW